MVTRRNFFFLAAGSIPAGENPWSQVDFWAAQPRMAQQFHLGGYGIVLGFRRKHTVSVVVRHIPGIEFQKSADRTGQATWDLVAMFACEKLISPCELYSYSILNTRHM